MNVNNEHWMSYSIDLAYKAICSGLHVGAVLVSAQDELLCSAYSGEETDMPWIAVMLDKVKTLKITNAHSIYVTINTLSVSCSFDLEELLDKICINEIFIGLPDPTLTYYRTDDPVILLNHVQRYPVELQYRILEQNEQYFAKSKQSIKYSPYYSENRISNLVIKELKLKGLNVSKNDINLNKHRSDLATLLCEKYGIGSFEAIDVVQEAISGAFNSKYGDYKYSDDTRSLDIAWKNRFLSFYNDSSEKQNLSNNVIVNVGVGSGHEAVALFSDCKYITFVDIAQTGLKRIKEQMPWARTIVSSAENLSSIPDNSHDLYVSLRTYNSSFFDIEKATREAFRVLRPKALIIVSVANGFLCPEQQCIIPGLILPGTEFIDIYRGLDVVKLMCSKFHQAGFNSIRVLPTNTEVYLSAIAP